MDRKTRAATTSLVAAFLSAGAAVASTAPAEAASSPQPAAVAGTSPVQWGDPLVRFLKLDGFPAYLKSDGFAQYNKDRTYLAQLSDLYQKDQSQVEDLLGLYHKVNAGPLEGILIGLEQYYKQDQDVGALRDYLKAPGAMDAYLKFETFLSALQDGAPLAFDSFLKLTGIAGDPLRLE